MGQKPTRGAGTTTAALIQNVAESFSDGVVLENAHDLEGRSVANKVILFPGGKGSSVVQSDGLYQLMMK